ncbi:MAG: CoA pyrophosphatase [Candidatus Cloacimonetes bacterium]|nr:CoA pyrophosphatase [Candidatus Cloacimonadota bacterium]
MDHAAPGDRHALLDGFEEFLARRSRRVLDFVDDKPAHRGTGAATGARQSAVLVCLAADHGNDLRLLYVVRSRTLTHHPGQIGFPGGRVEPADGGLVQAALRETLEEVAIPAERVRVLGLLDDQYTSASQHVVTPVLGMLDPEAQPRIVSDENESLFWMGLARLEAECRPVTLRAPGEPWKREGQWVFPTPCGPLWGLSSRITHNLLQILRQYHSLS